TVDFDYAGLNGSYEHKLVETIKWAVRFGDAPHLLWLAKEIAQRRPKRPDLAELVKELEASVGPPVANAPQPAIVAGGAIPQELESSLALCAEKHLTIQELAVDIRPKLRAGAYQDRDLPGACHLSHLDSHRLL